MIRTVRRIPNRWSAMALIAATAGVLACSGLTSTPTPVQPAAPLPTAAPSAEPPAPSSATAADAAGPRVVTTTGAISVFPDGTPDAVVRRALQAALDNDFDAYAALNVRDNRDTEVVLAQLRNYQWKVFQRRVSGYIIETAPFTVNVTRRDDPGADAPGPRRHKLFLFSSKRDNPAPIILQWEEGEWRIYANSL
jgi:hypothetical protein